MVASQRGKILRTKIERMEYLALSGLIISRNKLINDLLEEIPESEKAFRKGLSMRDKAWKQDKKIWNRARRLAEQELTECR